MVEGDLEAAEIGQMVGAHRCDEIAFAAPLHPGPDHDRSAVGVVGAEIDGAVATQLLKPHEDVGLDVLDQMPQMDLPVGIGQGRGREDAADGGWGHGFHYGGGKREL